MRVLIFLSAFTTLAAAPSVRLGDLALSFEPNTGQTAPEVNYLARGSSFTLYLTGAQSVLADRGQSPLRTRWVGSNPAAQIAGEDRQTSQTNYFVGNDPRKWRAALPNFAKVRYSGLYPGIDLVYYGKDGVLEYDWIVSPGADPRKIKMAFDTSRVRIDKQGDLVVQLAGGHEYRHRKPVVYQETAGRRTPVEGGWILRGNEAGFRVGVYDHARPLIIDPALIYSTYHGGNGLDYAYAVATDQSGNTYLTGTTGSANFPVLSSLQNLRGASDVFVTKINATGTSRVFSTFLGGGGLDVGNGIAVDSSGNVYVTGNAGSFDFPMMAAIQGTWGGSGDAFLTKLNAAGSALVYSTYLGGSALENGIAVALDSSRNAYITGITFSTNFPTVNPVQSGKGLLQDAFVAKINAAGSAWVYATYLGGNAVDEGNGIAADDTGNAYVTGYTASTNFPLQSAMRGSNNSVDVFVTKLNPTGSALVYSTYLGGTGTDYGTAIAVDSSFNAYVTGIASSGDFPMVNAMQPGIGGVEDSFVSKVNPSGSALVYSTYLGGGSTDDAYAIAVDSSGNAYVTGRTNSTDFPLTAPIQATRTAFDVFVTILTPDGSARVFSTFYGGAGSESGRGIAVDRVGNIHIAGETTSTDLVVPGALQGSNGGGAVPQDALILLLGDSLPPPGLSVAASHVGSFTQGQQGAAYTVTVANASGVMPTSGTVTVTETMPLGLTLVSMSGAGWTCPAAGTTCTRSDALAGGASYPPIAVSVNVASNAGPSVVNAVAIAGGNSAAAAANDTTTVLVPFADNNPADFWFAGVNLMRQYGITAGCGGSPPMYCPNDNVTRAQMAIFMVRAVMGGDNFTYSATPHFTDVGVSDFGFKWIQKMFELGITAGCGGGAYCPSDNVNRGQMAIFVIRARLGVAADSTFTYPGAPYFSDVPAGHPYFKWIQRMRLDQITGGCGVGIYCPNDPVTRGQMAIFIMRGAFNQLLPAGTPIISNASPAIAPAGQATTVTLIGLNTNFAQGTTQVSAGPGITAGTITVTNAVTLTVQLTVAANAASGPRTLLVATGSEQAVLPNGLTVP